MFSDEIYPKLSLWTILLMPLDIKWIMGFPLNRGLMIPRPRIVEIEYFLDNSGKTRGCSKSCASSISNASNVFRVRNGREERVKSICS